MMTMVAMDRYFVDARGGCVAVRDRDHTHSEDRGLHSDTRGVVWFRDGEQISRGRCEHCGADKGKAWIVPHQTLNAAQAECDRLNAQAVDAALGAGI